MTTRKIRLQVYLDTDAAERLDTYAGKTGMSRSAIATEALREYCAGQGVLELDQLYGPRLESLDRDLAKLERETASLGAHTEAMIELIGVFIQHQLTLVAHQPPFDEETGLLGQKRFRQLLELVERRLAQGGLVKQLRKPN
jgi:hypothetical protein